MMKEAWHSKNEKALICFLKGFFPLEMALLVLFLFLGFLGSLCVSWVGASEKERAVIWSFQAENRFSGSPVEIDGMVYAGSDDGSLYALDAESGEKKWIYKTDGAIRGGPVVQSEVVYAGSSDHHVYAFDWNSGERMWKFNTGGPVRSSPLVADGKVFVGNMKGDVHALKKESGEKIWSVNIGGQIRGQLSAGNDLLFVGSFDRDGYFYGLKQTTGEKEWVYRAGEGVSYLGSQHIGDVVFITGEASPGLDDVFAINSKTGKKRWSAQTETAMTAPPMVKEKKLFVGGGGRLNTYNIRNGEKIWSFSLKWGSVINSFFIEGGVIYVRAGSHLVTVDIESGKKRWLMEGFGGLGGVYVRGKGIFATGDKVYRIEER